MRVVRRGAGRPQAVHRPGRLDRRIARSAGLKVSDPSIDTSGGKRRATATLVYSPPDGGPEVESQRYRFTAPLTARMLPGTVNPSGPFWAPDSRQVAFFTTGKLMKIDVTGGPATTITTASGTARGGTWNQDDVIVFSTGSYLLRVSAVGGTPTPVTELDKSRNEAADVLP